MDDDQIKELINIAKQMADTHRDRSLANLWYGTYSRFVDQNAKAAASHFTLQNLEPGIDYNKFHDENMCNPN